MELNNSDIEELRRVISSLNLSETQLEELNSFLGNRDYIGVVEKLDFYLQLEIRNLERLEKFQTEASESGSVKEETNSRSVGDIVKASKFVNYYLENAFQLEEDAEDQAIVVATEQVASDLLKLREKMFEDADTVEINKVKDKLK